MSKYIDANKLRAEIERQIHILRSSIQSQGDYGQSCQIVAFEHIRDLIESLQEPAKRGYKDCNGCKYNRTLKDQIGWQFQGCFGGDYKGKPIAEIELCPLKIDILQEQEKPKWDDSDMRLDESELLSRFAFYTYKDEPEVLYLSNLFVEESFRNIGIGSKILAAAEKVAETLGATSIRLRVRYNFPANKWYRKNGYCYIAFEDGYDWLEKTLEYMKPKQEQEVDLYEEIDKEWKKCLPTDEGMGLESANIVNEQFGEIARHFYELGQQSIRQMPKINGWVAMDKKLEIAAGEYAIFHKDADKTYTSDEVYDMLTKAFIDGNNWNEKEV